MRFCNLCGGALELRIPLDDNRERHVCISCGQIHYQNPKIIVGAIPEYQGTILLCRRAIEPRYGLWTLPAGFMENGETTAEGAARETLEEANATVEIGELYSLYNVPHINQVHMLYRASLGAPDFSAGAESLDVKLFAEGDIPWNEIAFRPVKLTLEHYFSDRISGDFHFHTGVLHPLTRSQ